MSELKICRICLITNVRMHQILGSEVQNVYEKITNKKIQEDGYIYFACYMCYCQLKNCQQLVIKSQKADALLKEILPINSEVDTKTIALPDRVQCGLLNSLMISKMESFQIPEFTEVINTENKSGSYEVMIKYEPDDESPLPNNEPKLVENEQSTAKPTEDKRQQNIHTSKKPYKCQFCDYTSVRRNDLNRHIRFHTGEKPYKCQYCSFTGTTSGQLCVHIRSHTGEKPFVCQYCNYAFAQSSSLKIHIRTHTGEKPYECQYCSYKCTENGTLRAHIRIHTGEKPFKCQYCSYTCKQNGNLKAHVRTHTGKKPYVCEICDKKFTVSSALKKHFRVHNNAARYVIE